MGQHSTPRGERSSYNQANGSPGTPGYEGRHRAATETTGPTPVAGSDVPPRGAGVREIDTSR